MNRRNLLLGSLAFVPGRGLLGHTLADFATEVPTLTRADGYHAAIDLYWKPVTGATGYLIGISFSPGGFVVVAQVGAVNHFRLTNTEHDLNIIRDDVQQFVSIKALGPTGETAWAEPISVVPKSSRGASVIDLQVSKEGQENVHLMWTSSPGALFYLIERSHLGGAPVWVVVAAVPWTQLNWDDPDLDNGVDYYYHVTAQTSPSLWEQLKCDPWSDIYPPTWHPNLVPSESPLSSDLTLDECR